jgi:hypothetical protein
VLSRFFRRACKSNLLFISLILFLHWLVQSIYFLCNVQEVFFLGRSCNVAGAEASRSPCFTLSRSCSYHEYEMAGCCKQGHESDCCSESPWHKQRLFAAQTWTRLLLTSRSSTVAVRDLISVVLSDTEAGRVCKFFVICLGQSH